MPSHQIQMRSRNCRLLSDSSPSRDACFDRSKSPIPESRNRNSSTSSQLTMKSKRLRKRLQKTQRTLPKRRSKPLIACSEISTTQSMCRSWAEKMTKEFFLKNSLLKLRVFLTISLLSKRSRKLFRLIWKKVRPKRFRTNCQIIHSKELLIFLRSMRRRKWLTSSRLNSPIWPNRSMTRGLNC